MFVTKLQETITDDSLLKIGEFAFKFTSAPGNGKIVLPVGVTVRIIGNGELFSDNAKTQSLGTSFTRAASGPTECYFADDTDGFGLCPKYDFGFFQYLSSTKNLKSDDSDFIDYFKQNLTSLTTRNIVFPLKLSQLSRFSSATTFEISENEEVEGNLSDLANNTSLRNFNAIGCIGIKGAVSSLGNLVNLTSLQLYRCNQVTGDEASLLDALFANGKVSGTISITLSNYSIAKTYQFSSSGWTQV